MITIGGVNDGKCFFHRDICGASYVSYLCVGGSRSYWMVPGTQVE